MAEPTSNLALPTRPPSVFAAVLSYLVPGLGQIYQGRIAKGILFLVYLYSLFFVGMAMGDGKNVYLPDLAAGPEHRWENNPWKLSPPFTFIANLYNRPQFAGQFWIGVAAWPAIWHYNNMALPLQDRFPFLKDFQQGPRDFNDDVAMNDFLRNSDKTPDLGWVYTVIAGVLNVLVIYDAYTGPAFGIAATRPVPARPAQEAVRA
jgi:hypothetical protein